MNRKTRIGSIRIQFWRLSVTSQTNEGNREHPGWKGPLITAKGFGWDDTYFCYGLVHACFSYKFRDETTSVTGNRHTPLHISVFKLLNAFYADIICPYPLLFIFLQLLVFREINGNGNDQSGKLVLMRL